MYAAGKAIIEMEFCVVLTLLLSCLFTATVGDQLCLERKGECLHWPTNLCTAGWGENLCSGGRSRRCCLNCDTQCMAQEMVYRQNDTSCTSARGNCQVTSNFCNGKYEANMCAGPAIRQCCDPKSSPIENCPLLIFQPTNNTKGLNNHSIRIHPEFLPAMEAIDRSAKACNVQIFITHSFRKRQQRSHESTRVSQLRSNHLAGHAVAFAYLQTASGPCYGRCLLDRSNDAGNCFVRSIKEAKLRWGGDLNPPNAVLIDDGYSEDAAAWKQRVDLLQNNC